MDRRVGPSADTLDDCIVFGSPKLVDVVHTEHSLFLICGINIKMIKNVEKKTMLKNIF